MSSSVSVVGGGNHFDAHFAPVELSTVHHTGSTHGGVSRAELDNTEAARLAILCECDAGMQNPAEVFESLLQLLVVYAERQVAHMDGVCLFSGAVRLRSARVLTLLNRQTTTVVRLNRLVGTFAVTSCPVTVVVASATASCRAIIGAFLASATTSVDTASCRLAGSAVILIVSAVDVFKSVAGPTSAAATASSASSTFK